MYSAYDKNTISINAITYYLGLKSGYNVPNSDGHSMNCRC